MNIGEITSLIGLGDSPVEIFNTNEFDDTISINHLIPIKVLKVNQSYNQENVIDLSFDGITQGHLIFPKSKEEIIFSEMTEFEFIAFLNESCFDDYGFDSYKFRHNYILIKESFYSNYKENYLKTSSLWGGFSHNIVYAEPTTRLLNNVLEINTNYKLKDLDRYEYENSIRAIEQPYAFERFLKLYHLLELQFDYHLIKRIKGLMIPEDSNTIGNLLNDYSRNELDRLQDLITHYCTNLTPLLESLEIVIPFRSIATDMFIKFGKSNKTLNEVKFNNLFDSGSINESILSALKITNQNNPIETFLPKLISFWVYRIRCSIAHNKIGEYILSWEDENFIVDFAEPLLKEVLNQCFKK